MALLMALLMVGTGANGGDDVHIAFSVEVEVEEMLS